MKVILHGFGNLTCTTFKQTHRINKSTSKTDMVNYYIMFGLYRCNTYDARSCFC